jgi:hypothetical protein
VIFSKFPKEFCQPRIAHLESYSSKNAGGRGREEGGLET